jgi:hypothetical protein
MKLLLTKKCGMQQNLRLCTGNTTTRRMNTTEGNENQRPN